MSQINRIKRIKLIVSYLNLDSLKTHLNLLSKVLNNETTEDFRSTLLQSSLIFTI